MVTIMERIHIIRNNPQDRRILKNTLKAGAMVVLYMMMFYAMTQIAFGFYTSEKYDGFNRPAGTIIGGNLTESGADNFGLIDSTMYINGAGNGNVQDLLMNQSIAFTLNDSMSFQFKIDLESVNEFLTQFIYGGGIKRGGHRVLMEYGAVGNTIEVNVPSGAYVIGNYVIGQWHTLNYTWMWNGSVEIFFDGASGGIFTGTTADGNGIYQYDCLTGPCDINLDNFTIWTNHSTSSPNTPPEITLLYPVNESWTNDKINGTCEDTDGVLSVKINDSRFQRNTTFNFTSWTFDYIGTASDYINITINCTDNLSLTTENIFQLGIDIVPPSCSVLANTTIDYGMAYAWNVNCVDDYNLYALNVSCLNSSGTTFSFYQNNLNTTSYNFINSSGLQYQNFSCNWTSQDAHTDQNIKDKLNKDNMKAIGDRILINDFEYIETHQNVNEIILDFSGNSKVSFTYDMNVKIKGEPETKTFYVNAQEEIYYYEDEKYKAWFVIDNKYWVDFNLKNDKQAIYSVTKINNRKYQVDIWTTKEKLIFNSIGIINTNLQIQNIIVNPEATSSTNGTTINVNVAGLSDEQISFMIAVFCFLGLVFICFFGKNVGILYVITGIYGVGLSIVSYNTQALPSLVNWIFIFIGIAVVFYGWKQTENK